MIKYALFVAFLAVKSLYLPLNRRKSRYYWKFKIDDRIPLVPIFIIPYFGYFFLIIGSVIVLWNTAYVSEFLTTYIVSYILASIFWYIFPNGVARPKIIRKDPFSRLVKFVYRYDDDTNGFPSAHVFSTMICSYYLSLVFPGNGVFIWASALLVVVSTLLVKQHYVIDILGGAIVFALSVAIGANLW